jgi:GAF domain-containing protein
MCPSDGNDHPKPVVEPSPEPPDLTTRALQQRIRQQEILAELGVAALQGKAFLELLNETVRLTAEGMNAEFCKVLEYIPADNRLLVRAGVGWHDGIVGKATVGADLESPSGFALHTGKPVISNHLENEQRFRTPELLVEHGIRRAMNVILQGDGSPFGVLEVDSRSEENSVRTTLLSFRVPQTSWVWLSSVSDMSGGLRTPSTASRFFLRKLPTASKTVFKS